MLKVKEVSGTFCECEGDLCRLSEFENKLFLHISKACSQSDEKKYVEIKVQTMPRHGRPTGLPSAYVKRHVLSGSLSRCITAEI